MFIVALFSTLIQGFSDIFWKKSLGYGVGGKAHDILSYPTAFILVIYFLISGEDLSNINLYVFSITFAILFIAVIRTHIAQKIYKAEKMSVIMPYTNINKVLTIIFSFFLFADVSVISLFISILAVVIVILFSIDFKTLKFPRNIKMILFAEIISTLITLGGGWIIIVYGEIIYFVLAAVTGTIILSIFILIFGEHKTLKQLPKDFWISRIIGSLGWFSWFLSLVIIKNLGLSIYILLSFLGIGITLLLSYIFLKDKPSKKNLILTIVVSSLVGLGFYFK